MPSVRIVALRNNELTEKNVDIAINHSTWGMRTAGIHQDIKKGDFVIFLVGVSIANISQLASLPSYQNNVFPNYPNLVLSDETFIDKFHFLIEKIYFGEITSDFFIDESEIWPPRINEAEQKNYFKNRFRWQLTHQAEKLDITSSDMGTNFHSQIIRALRSKSVEPSSVDESNLSKLLEKMSTMTSENDENWYQEQVQDSKQIELPTGGITVNENDKATAKSTGWKRKPGIASLAINNANFQCEYDSSHLTFTAKKSGHNFVEAHHFIPMKFQADFKFSIDIPENILSLCPNCHSAFHYGDVDIQTKLIKNFYENKIAALNSREINISLDKVLDFYV